MNAQAAESSGAMDFVVSLDRAALNTITVVYATQDGTAAAGEN